jgi:hypothetical protein
MMTWSSGNLNVKSKSPLPGALNVEVVYDTSPRTTTTIAHEGSLMEGLRLSMLKQDGHGDLRGSGRWSVISYVHKEDCCIAVCAIRASIELARMDLRAPVSY